MSKPSKSLSVKLIKLLPWLVIAVIIGAIIRLHFFSIPSGHWGLQRTQTGVEVVEPGWHWAPLWREKVEVVRNPMKVVHFPLAARSALGERIELELSIPIHYRKEQLPALFTEFPRGKNIVRGLMGPVVAEAMLECSASRTAKELWKDPQDWKADFGKRSNAKLAVVLRHYRLEDAFSFGAPLVTKFEVRGGVKPVFEKPPVVSKKEARGSGVRMDAEPEPAVEKEAP